MTVRNDLLQDAASMLIKQEWKAALDLYNAFLARHPVSEGPLICAGGCLQHLNRYEEALVYYDRAIMLNPENENAHFNNGLALLSLGRWREGWREYEWRLRRVSTLLPPFPFLTSKKDAQNLMGSKVLIHSEQGFGDSMLCIRYASLLFAQGAEVFVSVQPELARLFAHINGVSRVIPHGELLTNCDFQVAMMSLPGIFETSLDTVPVNIPYITPLPELVSAWRMRMPETGRVRVGLVWEANRSNLASGALRSMSFEEISLLLDVDYIDFYSLQVGSHEMRENVILRRNLIDLSPQITDFADTAALIANLDLVITVDTAMVHLAGALGRQTFLLLPWNRDWRWLEHGGHAVWYPDICIFGQETAGDWRSVLQIVKNKLKIMSENSEE